MDLGSHAINLVRWYFGEITDIKSSLGYRFNMDFEDHATCIAKFASRTIAVINVGWFSRQSQIKVELLGTAKHTSAKHAAPNQIVTAIQLLLGRTPKSYSPFARELAHFVHCVEHDLPPSPSGNDALKYLETISSAYRNTLNLKDEPNSLHVHGVN